MAMTFFHGAADLDTGHVLRQVDAEGRGQEQVLKGLPYLRIFAGDDGGRKSAAANLLGMVGAREGRHARLVADLAGDDLAHEQAGLGLNALGEAEHRGIGGDKGRGTVAHAAKVRRRNGKDDGLGAVERLHELGRGDDVAGQLVAHKVAGVAVLAIDAGGRLLAMGPHGHALGSRGGKAGDGGSSEPEPISATFMALSYLSSGSVTRLVNESLDSLPVMSFLMFARWAHTTVMPISAMQNLSPRLLYGKTAQAAMGRPMAAASEPTDTNFVMATATINMPSSDRPIGQYQARMTPRPTAMPLPPWKLR